MVTRNWAADTAGFIKFRNAQFVSYKKTEEYRRALAESMEEDKKDGGMSARQTEEFLRVTLDRLKILSKAYPALPCDLGTAETYGKLKNELRKKGRPVPDNDIWIAALSQRHRLTLITRDQHFQEFDALSADIW
jgi:predicted nucleic acid-binding protein